MRFQIPAALVALAAFAIAAPAEKSAFDSLEKRTTHNGEGTVYLQEGATGSCGQTHTDGAKIAAISNYWQDYQSPGPFCGRMVQVTNVGSNDGVGGTGNTIIATVEDTCASCDENHIDFSVGSWNQLTNNAAYGTVEISWHFCNADGVC